MEQTTDEVVSSLRQRVEELAEQVRMLNATVDELGTRVSGLSRQVETAPASWTEDSGESLVVRSGDQRFQASTLLSTTATVCFLLVVALVLRMASDSGIINYQVGAFLGLVYAFALFLLAHVRYSRAHPAVPVYSTCAAILVFAIVLENHAQFTAAFPPLTYLILAGSGSVMLLLGVKHAVPTLVGMGTVGVSVITIAAGFPNPVFPLGAALILSANVAVCAHTRLPKCGWMAWGTLATTLFFWFAWTVKLTTALNRGEDPAPALAPAWFLPFLTAFVAWYLFLSVRNALRSGGSHRNFETVLPILTVAWSYPIARSVSGSELVPRAALGMFGLALAAGFLVFALLVAKQRGTLTREATSFILAGMLLCGFALPSLDWHVSGVVIIWGVIGFSLALLSWRWRSGLLRGISYLVQVYACGIAILTAGILSLERSSPWLISLALAVAGLCLGHYIWCRNRPPRDHGPFFTKVDPNDRTAIAPFLVAVIGSFGAARLVWFEVSATLESEGAFQCGQSVIINTAAILLLTVGFLKRSGEFFAVAALVAVIGGVKVFVYDFFHIRDLPLVISIFSFGLLAALSAVIWKRWQGATA